MRVPSWLWFRGRPRRAPGRAARGAARRPPGRSPRARPGSASRAGCRGCASRAGRTAAPGGAARRPLDAPGAQPLGPLDVLLAPSAPRDGRRRYRVGCHPPAPRRARSSLYQTRSARMGQSRYNPAHSARQESSVTESSVVTYRGRAIDLAPYLEGFPYSGFDSLPEANLLLYLHDLPEGRRLKAQPLDRPFDPALGRTLGDHDWNRRSFYGVTEYWPAANAGLLLSDESNDEVLNVYGLSLDSGALTRLTDVP